MVTAVTSASEAEPDVVEAGGEAAVEIQAAAPVEDRGAAAPAHTPSTPTPTPTPIDAWAPLLEAGVQRLGEISAASKGDGASRWVETDAHTGQRYLKLPVPEPQAVQRLAEGLLGLLRGLR